MNQYLVDFPKVKGPKLVIASVPGSRSITNRALLMAALSDERVTLKDCHASEDGKVMIRCLMDLGFEVSMEKNGLNLDVTIQGLSGRIPQKEAVLDVGSAGTVARFVLALLAFSDGRCTINASDQMKKRPIRPLIDALVISGAKVEYLEEEGNFPLRITGAFYDDPSIVQPTSYTVNIDQSSQFLSALLVAAPVLAFRTQKPITIAGIGSHGLEYIYLTAGMLKEFGIQISEMEPDSRCFKQNSSYFSFEPDPAQQEKTTASLQYVIMPERAKAPSEYTIEPDMSAACYFYALAAVLSITCEVSGVRQGNLQSDAAFLGVLSQMGCSIVESEEGIVRVTGPKEGKLKGDFTVDMSAFSDQALTLAAIAPYADGPITIKGIDHLRFQECDRINAMLTNLSAMGIHAEKSKDAKTAQETIMTFPRTTHEAITIFPGTIQPATIETFGDHRVAMAFALSGLRAEGITINDPDCCKKTFADYFELLDDIKMQLADQLIMSSGSPRTSGSH